MASRAGSWAAQLHQARHVAAKHLALGEATHQGAQLLVAVAQPRYFPSVQIVRFSQQPDMDPFVDQLKGVCTAYPTRSKWVFVPTHAIGRTLGDRMVLEGTEWANLRFVTPLDVALLMGAPFLVERGIDPSEEDLG